MRGLSAVHVSHRRLARVLGVGAVVAACLGGAVPAQARRSTARSTVPVTPSVKTMWGTKHGNTRTYRLTASLKEYPADRG